MAEFADSRELQKRKQKILRSLGKNENDIQETDTILLIQTKKELTEYFSGKRRTFDIPLELFGTDFQKKAWQALIKIPYGETRSYKEEALLMGHPKAVRAIG
jgi:methylated-DNA-[protein]-cysteine S-methyltransferase